MVPKMVERRSEIQKSDQNLLGYYDFFAGAGLVRLGLEPHWRCLWANDIDRRKAEVYMRNFGGKELVVCDIAEVKGRDIPGRADMAWASFPCQDLSFAGTKLGMRGRRSGTFWEFIRILRELQEESRLPPIVVVENVQGLLKPENLEPVCESLVEMGLLYGALLIDARYFLPHSRPRVFIVAADPRAVEVTNLAMSTPSGSSPWLPKRVLRAFEELPARLKERWVWWNLPVPDHKPPSLQSLLLLNGDIEDAVWHSDKETERLLSLMSPTNLAKVEAARRLGYPVIGTVYRRMRNGQQRAEIRVDGLAGCLRASRGGSSRLIIMLIEGDNVRSRRLSAREAARLMGVPDSFWLPNRYGDAYNAVADGVAVPVTAWLSKHLLIPLAKTAKKKGKTAAPV